MRRIDAYVKAKERYYLEISADRTTKSLVQKSEWLYYLNMKVQNASKNYNMAVIYTILLCIILFTLIWLKSQNYINLITLFLVTLFLLGTVMISLGLYIITSNRINEPIALHFHLNTQIFEGYNLLRSAFQGVLSSNLLWSVTSSSTSPSRTENVTQHQMNRSPISPHEGSLRYVNFDMKAPPLGVTYSGTTWVLLPDQLLRQRSDNFYNSFDLTSLTCTLTLLDFTEMSDLPTDAEILDQVWLHHRIDGNPDRRYKYNRKVSVMRYAELVFRDDSGATILDLVVSRVSSATIFNAEFQRYVQLLNGKVTTQSTDYSESQRRQNDPKSKSGNTQKETHSNASREDPSSQHRQSNPKSKSENTRKETHSNAGREDPSPVKPKAAFDAYKILKISPNATEAEIKAAYRKLAQDYHPDHVAHLAPEFRALADEKMKEINAAYEIVKRKFN